MRITMTRRSRTILCADADRFGMDVRRMVLERFGFRVITATTGASALRQILSRRVHAVVLDRDLEEMGGAELARRIKSLRPGTPVIMLSNLVYPPETALPYIDAFLTKGDPPESLVATIDQLRHPIEERETRAERLIWAGGLVITGLAWLLKRSFTGSHGAPCATSNPVRKTGGTAPAMERRFRGTKAAHA